MTRRRIAPLVAAAAATVLASIASGAAPSSDYPWQGPPATLVSAMRHPPRYVAHVTNAVSGDGRFVVFSRANLHSPGRLILRNVARAHDRVVARPPVGFDYRDYETGRIPSPGYNPPDLTPDGRYLVFSTSYRLTSETETTMPTCTATTGWTAPTSS